MTKSSNLFPDVRMHSVRTRVALPADFASIQSLVFGSHAEALSKSGKDVTSLLPVIFPTLTCLEEFMRPTSHYWIAEEAGANEIIGAISIIRSAEDPRTVDLNAFYVREKCQRSGVGAQLMGCALEFCRASDICRVELISNRGCYDPAIAYYQRIGFQLLREYEVSPGIVLVDMALELK